MSVLIPTKKETDDEIITIKENPLDDYVLEIITSNEEGLSKARNGLVDLAKESPLIFLDDDIWLSTDLLDLIDDLAPKWTEKMLYMAEGGNHPTSRVMILTKELFDDIGGFDENIKYNGEDYDFYLRALKKGYWVTIIPSTEIRHKPHKKSNWFKYHFEAPYVRIKHHKVGVNFFFYRNPLVMLLRMAGFLYYKLIKGVKPI